MEVGRPWRQDSVSTVHDNLLAKMANHHSIVPDVQVVVRLPRILAGSPRQAFSMRCRRPRDRSSKIAVLRPSRYLGDADQCHHRENASRSTNGPQQGFSVSRGRPPRPRLLRRSWSSRCFDRANRYVECLPVQPERVHQRKRIPPALDKS